MPPMKKPVRMIVITTFGEVGPCQGDDLQGLIDQKAIHATDMVRQTNGRILGTVAAVMAGTEAAGTSSDQARPAVAPAIETDGVPTVILSASANASPSSAGQPRGGTSRAHPPAIPAAPAPTSAGPSPTVAPLTRRLRAGAQKNTASRRHAVTPTTTEGIIASKVEAPVAPAATGSGSGPGAETKPAAMPRPVGKRRAGSDGTAAHRPAPSSSRRLVWLLGGVGICFVGVGITAGLMLLSKPIPPPASASPPVVAATAVASDQPRPLEPTTAPAPASPAEAPAPVPSVPAPTIAKTPVVPAIAAIPAPVPMPPPPPPSSPITLLASEARLTGVLKLEGQPPNIGYWIKAQDSATWSVHVDQPGSFAVALEYALESGGRSNEFALEVGGKTLTGSVKATRNWKDYTCIKAGTIAVPTAGEVAIVLKPARQPKGGLMNLRKVILTPIIP